MEIFDPLRKKYVKQTPEETVRQNVIQWLSASIGVPMTHMMSEVAFTFNGLQYRADIVVYDKQLKPLMFVECKAPDIPIDNKVIDQCIRYFQVLKVEYILTTNGKTSYLCSWNPEKQQFEFIRECPDYQKMLVGREL